MMWEESYLQENGSKSTSNITLSLSLSIYIYIYVCMYVCIQLPQSTIMEYRGNSKNKAALKSSVGKSIPPAAYVFLHVSVKVVFSNCGLEISCIRINWHELAENVNSQMPSPKTLMLFSLE